MELQVSKIPGMGHSYGIKPGLGFREQSGQDRPWESGHSPKGNREPLKAVLGT